MSAREFSGADAGDFRRGKLKWDILNAAAHHRRVMPGTIDLTNCTFLRPYAIACLCAIGAKTRRTCKLILPDDERCRGHLSRMGLLEWFEVGPSAASTSARETNVVLECLTEQPGIASDRVIDLLTKGLSLAAGEATPLKDHLDEVILNALTHSESPIGCVVAGQAFPKRNLLELAILDLGCTIPGHLRKNPQYRSIVSEGEVVLKATENGVTGTVGRNKWNAVNSGAGLFELRTFCESGRGELAIVTAGVIATFEPHVGSSVRQFAGGFSGCLVNIRFFLNNDLQPREESASIW